MDLVGYKLKNIETNEYIQQWGGSFNTIPPLPPVLYLPNGDHVWAPRVGATYNGFILEEWYKEPPKPPVIIPEISDRQFFQQAAIQGMITQEEALAAVQTGSIPANLQSIVDTIQNESEKFAATMILSGATTFNRNHPLTETIGDYLGMTSDQIDSFFLDASRL